MFVRSGFLKKREVKRMKNFTTNWYLYNSLNPKNKPKEEAKTEVESKEIKNNIKWVKKAFR